MNRHVTPRMIAGVPKATSGSPDGHFSRGDVSTLTRKEIGRSCPTVMNLCLGTEFLVIDGEWRRLRVCTIINSLQ